MGSLSTGVGLISGINTADLISQLIAVEAQGKIPLQQRVSSLQASKTALLDINAQLLNLKSASSAFRTNSIFDSALATSSNEDVLTATANSSAQPGTSQFIVKQLVSTSQELSQGYATADATPLGLDELSFEFGNGSLADDTDLAVLNGGAGVDRGQIVITDSASATATIDLGAATTVNEVLEKINTAGGVSVNASIQGDHLVITDNAGGSLTISDAAGDTTATDLGIAGTASGSIVGSNINTLGANTALSSLNDGNGVLIRDNVADFVIDVDGAGSFSIDLGRVDAPITTETNLSDLNSGTGVEFTNGEPDLLIVDKTGTTHEINLGQILDENDEVVEGPVETVQDLANRISDQTDSAVTLSVNAAGDGFDLTDTTGGSDDLQVLGAGVNGSETAEDLGVLGSTSGTVLNGNTVPSTIQTGQASTLQEIFDRIADQTGGVVTASVSADGKGISLNAGGAAITLGGGAIDSSSIGDEIAGKTLANLGFSVNQSGSSVAGGRILSGLNTKLVKNLNGGEGVIGTGVGTLSGETLLNDLFEGQGLTTNNNASSPDISVQDRTGATYQIEADGLTTVQDLIDEFNSTTGGAVTLSINGQSLQATNNASGINTFVIDDINGSSAASDLGIVVDNTATESDTVIGNDTQPAIELSTVFDITNRQGQVTNIDASSAETVRDVIEVINDSSAGVVASLNNAGNGISITDTTGGSSNLIISGTGADTLGIATDPAGVAESTVSGDNLQLQYVNESSKLSQLNYGQGVGTGEFKITDSTGQFATIDIASDSTTLYDVIKEINSRSIFVEARVNNNGDGLVLVDTAAAEAETPESLLKVETVNGTTAADLGILGEAATVGGNINGSYEKSVDLETSDTLEGVVEKINDAGHPVSASVLNTGAGGQPYHLSLSSQVTGSAGSLVVDSGDTNLGLTTLSEGSDAKVFFGADNAADGLLIKSSTNTIENAVQGVTIDLLATSDTPTTVTVSEDTTKVLDSVNAFVTAFNDTIAKINEYDFYDVEEEEKGPLLSNPTVARVRQQLYSTLQGKAKGITTQYQYLSEVGIRIGGEGKIEFDQEKFEAAYADDPEAVENLFASFDEQTQTEEEVIADGITVENSTTTINSAGFGDLFDQLLDGLTDSFDGLLTKADENFQELIDLTNDRIERFDQRLEAKKARLEQKFAAMETALAQLQNQQGALQSLQSNVAAAAGA